MRKLTLALGGFLALAGAVPAVADEAKTPIPSALMLSIVAPRIESRASAYDQALKDTDPAPRSTDGVVQPDGSVKYGNVTVTVRNPCPPNTAHYEPQPLPGRRVRN
jgi:hypothetical protein